MFVVLTLKATGREKVEGSLSRVIVKDLPLELRKWKDLANYKYRIQFKQASEIEFKKCIDIETFCLVDKREAKGKIIPLT